MVFNLRTLFCLSAIAVQASPSVRAEAPLVRSAASGRWSESSTWENGRLPGTGERVLIRSGHAVTYDVRIEDSPIRSIHVAGTLEFARDRDVVLTVGLIKVQAGEDPSETGLDVHEGMVEHDAGTSLPRSWWGRLNVRFPPVTQRSSDWPKSKASTRRLARRSSARGGGWSSMAPA